MESGGFCEVTKWLLLIERNKFLLYQKVKSEPVSDKNKLLVGVTLRKLLERITLKTMYSCCIHVVMKTIKLDLVLLNPGPMLKHV